MCIKNTTIGLTIKKPHKINNQFNANKPSQATKSNEFFIINFSFQQDQSPTPFLQYVLEVPQRPRPYIHYYTSIGTYVYTVFTDRTETR